MRKRKQSPNTRMPLLELIIMIGVFAVISVFLLEMFLAANSMQQRAKDKGKAITLLQNLAETVKGSQSFSQTIEAMQLKEGWGILTKSEDGVYQITQVGEDPIEKGTRVYLAHFDKNWKSVEKEDTYSMVIFPYEENIQGKTVRNYQAYVYRLGGYASVKPDRGNTELSHLCFSAYSSETGEK